MRGLADVRHPAVAACGTSPPKPDTATPSAPPPPSTPSTRYYKDDGPGDAPPANLDQIPDATPRLEPLHRFANRPYTVLGRDYVPATALRPYKERGVASWYGRKFHGQKTSIGEIYDMYAMTAAHPTLPLPSYARVTNVATGKSVVVRVNDRGPFLHGRIIDLSYAAAHRVGIAQQGSGEVEVEAIIPRRAPALDCRRARCRRSRRRRRADRAPVTRRRRRAVAASAAASSCSSARSQNFANAQSFLAHVQNQLAAARGRTEGARGQRAVSRLRRPVRRPRRGEARGGAHRQRIRHRDRDRAALNVFAELAAAPSWSTPRGDDPFVIIRGVAAASTCASRGATRPHRQSQACTARSASSSLFSRCVLVSSRRPRPAHHRDRRRRRHGDPDRDRAVRRRGTSRSASPASSAPISRARACSGSIDTDGIDAAPVARRGRSVPTYWRARGADAVVVGLDAAAARRPRRGALRAGRRGQADARSPR